jgi:two-component system cell cycle sensor histidine kinase/response regulator CckA
MQPNTEDGRYRAIFESLPTSVLVFDIGLQIVDANPAVERQLGYAPQELVGLKAEDIAVAEDVERERPLLDDLATGRRDWYVIEKRYVRKDGVLMSGRSLAAAVHEPDGQVRYILKVLDDITVERERDELQRHAQKLEALGRLSGGIAHDFNNLLQAVSGHAQLALAAGDLAGAQLHVRAVLAAATRAASVTEQLLTFSRKQPFHPMRVDLNETVAQTAPMLEPLLPPAIRLVTRLAPEPCVVACDRTQLGQIVLNLAVNARDAMSGGGELSIETQRRRRDGRDCALLVVADSGDGMDEETLARAFDPFFTTKPVGKGTGLGLSTVDGIVAQYGGTIDVESSPGAGTRVEISFPFAAGHAEAASVPSAPAVGGGNGDETVVLVDDDEMVRLVASDYLGAQGYRVLAAASGAQALRLFDRERVDLLVTDVIMPEMSGHDLYRAAAERQPGLPVVYMSGYDPETAAVPEAGSSSAFLQKPYNLTELGELVRTLLAARDSARP